MFNPQTDPFARWTAARRLGAEAAVSLRRPRVWHAPDEAGGKGGNGQAPKTPDKPDDQDTPSETPPDKPDDQEPRDVASLPGWAQKLITDTRAEAARHRTEARRIEDEKRRQETARLEADKEFEKLANTYKTELETARPKAERVDALEGYIKQSVETRVAALPSDVRGLVPEYDDPLRTLAWLDANAARLAPQRAPDLNGGAGGGSGAANVKLTDDERAVARLANMTDAQYAEYRQKGAAAPALRDQLPAALRANQG